MSTPHLQPGKIGLIHFTLRDDDGKVLDASDGGPPMPILMGAENIVPGLEAALLGKGAGDEVQVSVPPAQGYGERTGPGPQAVPKRELGRRAKGLRVGMPVAVQASDGNEVILWVTRVHGARVWLDIDHPLAGKTLHYQVSVLHGRDATDEECAHGHVHGPGGHPH